MNLKTARRTTLRTKLFAAFTLTELLVVMAIFAVLAGLGIQGMIIFRQVIQFQQTETDIISSFSSVRNRARNSVASENRDPGSNLSEAVVDGYALYFNDGNYSLRTCTSTTSLGITQINCLPIEREQVKANILDPVDVYPVEPAKCKLLYFKRLTGDISAAPDIIGSPTDVGVCTIRIQHKERTSLQRDIILDLQNNTSDIFQ